MIKNNVQKFGKSLSGMVMPNIGAFIAWGLITALFISAGWFPNEQLATLVDPILKYLLPVLIAMSGGRMIAGDRGAIMGAIAAMGVIVGSDIPMFIGAMFIGPFSGFVIKKFDKFMENRMPAGFEMLINNFSIGILGMLCAILGFFAVGPFITILTGILKSGVEFIIVKGLLPLVAIFIEPAKVLFLNNAINHGILSPIGIEQAKQTGQSIMFLLEANPGPGLGVLLAYCICAKGSAKQSAPGAAIIHFFGGIHEIYFPYILMNPKIILSPIAGSAAAILFYSMFNTGLVAPPSPGSVIAIAALAPKGSILVILGGIAIATVVSFLVAAPFVKAASKNDDSDDFEASKIKAKNMKSIQKSSINKIVFACDAGMGSSAMGSTKFKNRLKSVGILDINVSNTSVDTIPADTDIVVCQITLADRAKKSAPDSEHIFIENFLSDSNLDTLLDRIKGLKLGTIGEMHSTPEVLEEQTKAGILSESNILLGLAPESKEDAIKRTGKLLVKGGYVKEAYVEAMLDREKITTTYLGMGLAIPHGTSEAKEDILKTGIVVLQYPDGISFGDEKAYILVGIAGVGDEHLNILSKISTAFEDENAIELLKTTKDIGIILNKFS